MPLLTDLVDALQSGSARVVDLTQGIAGAMLRAVAGCAHELTEGERRTSSPGDQVGCGV